MTRSIQQDRDFIHAILTTRKSTLPPEIRIDIWHRLLARYSASQSAPRKKQPGSYSACESLTYINLGQDLEAVGRLDEALEAYWQARLHTGMAQVYRKMGQRENALACLKRAEKNDRNTPRILLLEAEVRGELGEYDEVTRLLKLAFCRTPEDERLPEIYQRIQEIGERFDVPVPIPTIPPR